MKLACVVFCVTLALTLASDVPECPNLSEDKLSELKKLIVTEDFHDQYAGEFSDLYGSKEIVEADENSCIKRSTQKVDDKELVCSMRFKGEWFGGEKTKNATLEKIANGVYLVKKHDGEIKGKVYTVYAKNNVYAFYMCRFNKGPSEEKKPEKRSGGKKNKLPACSSISIRSQDLKSPLDAEVQEAVDEAVLKLQGAQELFGAVTKYPHPC